MTNEKLPSSWSLAPLDALGLWSGGGTPSKSVSEFWRNGTIPWVSSKDMKTFEIAETDDMITEDAVRNSATSILPTGSILIVTRSGILRHTLPVAVTRIPVTVNQDLKALRPESGMEPRYIAYALKAEQQEILHSCAKDGTTVQSVEFDQLKRFRIAVAPENEQRRIADAVDEILSDLDAGVEALKRALAKLKLYRASVLKAAVTGALTSDWRAAHPDAEPASELLARILKERRRLWEAEQLRKYEAAGKRPPANWKSKYKEPLAPDTTKLPHLAKGWCWVNMEQVTRIQGGLQKTPDRSPRAQYAPYLRVGNVLRGRLDLSRLERFELTPAELERLRLLPGDVLIVEGNGSRNEIGRNAIWNGEVDDCIHQNHIIRCRAYEGLRPDFLSNFLNSTAGQNAIHSVASSTSGLYTLSVSKIASLAIPLAPFQEQEAAMQIVSEQLSVADHISEELTAKTGALLALRQAALRHAFTGQLLPQDPSDEPAHVLLERIALERAERAAEARRQKLGGAKRKAGSPTRRPPDQQNNRSKRNSRTRDTAKQTHEEAAATA